MIDQDVLGIMWIEMILKRYLHKRDLQNVAAGADELKFNACLDEMIDMGLLVVNDDVVELGPVTLAVVLPIDTEDLISDVEAFLQS